MWSPVRFVGWLAGCLSTGRFPVHVLTSVRYSPSLLRKMSLEEITDASIFPGPCHWSPRFSMAEYDAWNELATNDARVVMEWNREKTLELLREYQQRRVLWDYNARGYRNLATRRRAIQELANIFGCTTLEIEKKVTHLKCQYSRELHKIKNYRPTRPGDVFVSKWYGFKAMQFLRIGTCRQSRRKKKVDEDVVSDIMFIDCDKEPNCSEADSFNPLPTENTEEESSWNAMRLYHGSLQEQTDPIGDYDEYGDTKVGIMSGSSMENLSATFSNP